jgi:uncharacterized SAM-binding protein YcdF (DUF218 family)
MLSGVSGFPVPPSARRRWWRWTPLYLSVALVAGYFGGVIFAPVVLGVTNGSGRGEVIVVLGGESWTRVQRAAELYQSGAAPWVLVSGAGDTGQYSRDLMKLGVPRERILLEDDSSTTAENARFTAPLLRARGFTNVVLVTSWYHARRALACFEHYAPELHFSSRPTPRTSTGLWPNPYERQRVLMEYVKLGGYVFRHGIPPW